MTELMKIQPFIQAYVLAVASILNTEVTIVDKDLIRVGGTGNYEKDIGSRVPHDSFFQGVLTSGKTGIIRNVKEECAYLKSLNLADILIIDCWHTFCCNYRYKKYI